MRARCVLAEVVAEEAIVFAEASGEGRQEVLEDAISGLQQLGGARRGPADQGFAAGSGASGSAVPTLALCASLPLEKIRLKKPPLLLAGAGSGAGAGATARGVFARGVLPFFFLRFGALDAAPVATFQSSADFCLIAGGRRRRFFRGRVASHQHAAAQSSARSCHRDAAAMLSGAHSR